MRMAVQFFVLFLVFVAGYASQRGRTCAVSAAFEIAKRQRARRFAGYLFAAACSLTVLSVISLFDPGLFSGFGNYWPSASTVLGGVVFAGGAYVNGRCSLGTIARLGSGDLSRIGTLLGIFCGIALGISFMPVSASGGAAPAFAALPPPTRIVIAPASTALLAILLRRIVPRGFNAVQWSIPKAMIVIGVVNGLLVWLARDWSYTTLFRHVARGEAGTSFGGLVLLVLVGGAIAGGLVSGQLVWRVGAARDWVLAGAGGLLMGIGVVLVPGGNDTMLLVGLPLLLPNLIAGYAVMYATLIALAWVTPNRPVAA